MNNKHVSVLCNAMTNKDITVWDGACSSLYYF